MSGRARLGALIGGALSLWLLAPLLTEVYASSDVARRANPWWVTAAVGSMAGGFACCWVLQRITLRADRWSDVIAPQMAGNAASNVLPMGSALGSLVQLRMLLRRNIDLPRSVTALTITGMVTNVAGLLVFPVVLLVPVGDLGEIDVAPVARLGLAALVITVPLVYLALRSERALSLVARACHQALRHLPGCHPRADLAGTIVTERDEVRVALGRHKAAVATAAIGRSLGDFVALWASMLAVGLHPSPTLVLVAFVAANTAGMVPLTPGGLGFVEAGLSGALLLAGAPEAQAVGAVAIYRLVSCWLPVAAGMYAYVWARRSAETAPATRTSSLGAIGKTCVGVPAAAHTTS